MVEEEHDKCLHLVEHSPEIMLLLDGEDEGNCGIPDPRKKNKN